MQEKSWRHTKQTDLKHLKRNPPMRQALSIAGGGDARFWLITKNNVFSSSKLVIAAAATTGLRSGSMITATEKHSMACPTTRYVDAKQWIVPRSMAEQCLW